MNTCIDATPGICTLRPAFRQILTLARREIRDSLRNRWFLLYAGLFTVLTLGLSCMSLAGTGLSGMAGFGRTAASLINVVVLIVPLMALTIGAGAIAGERERGTMEYLLSYPITRGEFLWGKWLGSAAAVLTSLTIGFGVSAVVMACNGRGQQVGSLLTLIAASDLLALEMLSVGLLISTLAGRNSVAIGVAILAWFVLGFLSDLGLMGSTLAFKLPIQQLFHLSLLNPMQGFKMLVLGSLNTSLDVLGPAGGYATLRYGHKLPLIFCGAAALWIVLPAAAAYAILSRRSDA